VKYNSSTICNLLCFFFFFLDYSTVQPAITEISSSGAGREAIHNAVKTVLIYISNCLDRLEQYTGDWLYSFQLIMGEGDAIIC
jgi:hypothetical protein